MDSSPVFFLSHMLGQSQAKIKSQPNSQGQVPLVGGMGDLNPTPFIESMFQELLVKHGFREGGPGGAKTHRERRRLGTAFLKSLDPRVMHHQCSSLNMGKVTGAWDAPAHCVATMNTCPKTLTTI